MSWKNYQFKPAPAFMCMWPVKLLRPTFGSFVRPRQADGEPAQLRLRGRGPDAPHLPSFRAARGDRSIDANSYDLRPFHEIVIEVGGEGLLSWSGVTSRQIAGGLSHLASDGASSSPAPISRQPISARVRCGPFQIAEELKSSTVSTDNAPRQRTGSAYGSCSRPVPSPCGWTRIGFARLSPDMEPTDLQGPLASRSRRRASPGQRRDVRTVPHTINTAGGDAALGDRALEDTFDIWWPKLEEKVSQKIPAPRPGSHLEELNRAAGTLWKIHCCRTDSRKLR